MKGKRRGWDKDTLVKASGIISGIGGVYRGGSSALKHKNKLERESVATKEPGSRKHP